METRVSLKYFASGCSICIDNRKLPLALKKVKGITKISACYLQLSTQIRQKLRIEETTFCFKNKTQVARNRKITQIKKCQFWKKRLFSKKFFTSAGEMPKTKGKNPDKMYNLIYFKQQKQ